MLSLPSLASVHDHTAGSLGHCSQKQIDKPPKILCTSGRGAVVMSALVIRRRSGEQRLVTTDGSSVSLVQQNCAIFPTVVRGNMQWALTRIASVRLCESSLRLSSWLTPVQWKNRHDVSSYQPN